jgi:hypothetical protein
MEAQTTAAAEAAGFVTILNDVILFPLILLLSGIAFLVFIWGCVEYVMNSSNEQARAQGAKHITYGIIGLLVMVSAYAILSVAAGTFGLDAQLDCANDPGGCSAAFTL